MYPGEEKEVGNFKYLGNLLTEMVIEVSVSQADKIFKLQGDAQHKFEEIIQEIPVDCVLVSEEIITYIKENSDFKVDDQIYVTLTDHIANTIERIQMGIDFDMSILLNIKALYRKEYELALHAVQIIRDAFHIKIADEEASFITLHIINAESESNMFLTSKITKILSELIEIVHRHFDLAVDFNRDYDRFIVHCRFFVQRVVSEEHLDTTSIQTIELYDLLKEKSPKQYECIQEITEYFKKMYDYEVSAEEEVYLLIHLNKLTK